MSEKKTKKKTANRKEFQQFRIRLPLLNSPKVANLIKSNLLLYLFYNGEALNEFAVAHLGIIVPGKHSPFRKNVAIVADRW